MDKRLKICIAAPSHAYQYYGGGEVFLDKTVEYLKKEGLEIKLFDSWHDKIEDFDLVHFFGIGYFNYEFIKMVKAKNKKLVITPMFPTLVGSRNLVRIIYHNLCFIVPFLKTPPELMHRSVMLADMVLANSDIEKKQICSLLKGDPGRIRVVHCGVDKRFMDADPGPFIEKYRIKDFILCVGRFDSNQKNQLNLVRAMRDSRIPMVFVGSPDKGMERYYNMCQEESPEGTLFIKHLDHDDKMLASCYAAARTLVVPSRYEYPGLIVMEAILSGCKRLAVTRGGSTKEYYKNYAHYFNPDSISDIRRAVLEVNSSEPIGDSAREYFKKNYLWENYAGDVLKAYKSVL